MPSILIKQQITKELLDSKFFPKEVLDIIDAGDGQTADVLNTFWNSLRGAIGGVELAYRRGYQAGQESVSPAAADGVDYRAAE